MSMSSQDDFQQFLDLGMHNLGDTLQFDFPEWGSTEHNGTVRDGGEAMDMRMDGDNVGFAQKDMLMQGTMTTMLPSNHSTIPNTPVEQDLAAADLSQLDAQIEYLQQQRSHQQQLQLQTQQRNYYASNQMVPPTPNSIEMHGNMTQYCPPGEQVGYDQYQRQGREQEVGSYVENDTDAC